MAGSQQPGMRGRLSGVADAVRGLPDRVPLVARSMHQLVRVNLLDCATRLAAQAFVSALPALFVVAVFAPASVKEGVVSALREQLGLQGEAGKQVGELMSAGDGDATAQSFGAIGALVTLLSATALSRALQRVCERCWELPRASGRITAWRWLLWLAVWMVSLVLQHPLYDGFGAGPWLGLPLAFAVETLLWWWTQHLLLAGRVGWRQLAPGALLCGVAVVGTGVAASVYLPRAVAQSVSRFGPYGVVFTMLSWLIVTFTAVTLAIALGRVVSEEPEVARRFGTGRSGPAAAGPPASGPAAGGPPAAGPPVDGPPADDPPAAGTPDRVMGGPAEEAPATGM
ncbi:hypothetical protein KNE206_79090 [Kitasatospora sp. NE20-6]|uniref:YhjD/YihY/BrkB family envelope integrity protein n=1 Tax=Kitasatospora sp. NE20-6 TaxID=2859066 RepID=UPI0034DC79AC